MLPDFASLSFLNTVNSLTVKDNQGWDREQCKHTVLLCSLKWFSCRSRLKFTESFNSSTLSLSLDVENTIPAGTSVLMPFPPCRIRNTSIGTITTDEKPSASKLDQSVQVSSESRWPAAGLLCCGRRLIQRVGRKRSYLVSCSVNLKIRISRPLCSSSRRQDEQSDS